MKKVDLQVGELRDMLPGRGIKGLKHQESHDLKYFARLQLQLLRYDHGYDCFGPWLCHFWSLHAGFAQSWTHSTFHIPVNITMDHGHNFTTQGSSGIRGYPPLRKLPILRSLQADSQIEMEPQNCPGPVQPTVRL